MLQCCPELPKGSKVLAIVLVFIFFSNDARRVEYESRWALLLQICMSYFMIVIHFIDLITGRTANTRVRALREADSDSDKTHIPCSLND